MPDLRCCLRTGGFRHRSYRCDFRTIHQFDQRHRRFVADAEAVLEDAQIAARALGVTRPEVANKRLAFSRLRDRDMVVKLFGELGPRYAKRPGGYLRILKYGFRVGDKAPMALVELVDRPEVAAVTPVTEAAGS